MKTSIVVRTRYEGLHFWKSAPEKVAFLRNLHRHEFHVALKLEVHHDDRELEFILVKRAMNQYLQDTHDQDPNGRSCEQIAKCVLDWVVKTYGVRRASCEVSEDGENGAVVEIEP